ncbi:hypothetical protein BgiBS90_009024 [Biomphalaria glabrata]|nr:hypothetical protein BgiMline_006256 [Biomphalaria glabrata]KAI8791100.1 hypothetical protein BgiBS90_009024 [Biomphalaria glabrata]
MPTSKNIASERTIFVFHHINYDHHVRPSRELHGEPLFECMKPRPSLVLSKCQDCTFVLAVALMKAMTKPEFPGGRSKEEGQGLDAICP